MSNWQKVLVDRFVLFNMFKLTLHNTMTIWFDMFLSLSVPEVITDVDVQIYFIELSTISGTSNVDGRRVNYSTS